MVEGVNVRVVFATPEHQADVPVTLPEGATIGDAIGAAGLESRFPGVSLDNLRCGIWNKLKPRETVLREGDRVELYRPLKADPNAARQARVAKKRAAGKG